MPDPRSASTCGKQRHRDRPKADRAARALRERGVQGAHAYHCSGCHAWHVGSTRAGVGGAPPPPMKPARHHRRAEVEDPPGTRFCVDGCGHRADLHAAGMCLGDRGACPCTSTPAVLR